MRKVELARATHLLSEYAKTGDKEAVVVTRRGRPFAAVVPFDSDAWEDFVVSTHPDFIAIIERSNARYKAEGGISTEEMRRRLAARDHAPLAARRKALRQRKAG